VSSRTETIATRLEMVDQMAENTTETTTLDMIATQQLPYYSFTSLS